MPARRHGLSTSEIYRVWAQIVNRCRNPAVKSYKYYGARGITVCDRWLKFDNFFEDMGHAPPGCSIDRINNDGPYSPRNCRWATRQEQAQHKSNSRLLTLGKRTQTMAAWARELGMNPSALLYRINAGWSVKEVLTTPKPERPNAKLNMRQARAIRARHPGWSMDKIAAHYGVSKKTIVNIVHGRIFVEP